MNKRLIAPVVLIVCPACLLVNTPPANSPEQSRQLLREIAATRSYSRGQPAQITITPDGSQVLFLRSDPRSRVLSLYARDTASSQCRVLISPESLLGGFPESMTPEEKARRERQRVTSMGITSYSLSEDGKLVLIPLSGRLYVVERANGKTVKLERVDNVTDARFSPDGNFVSFIRDHDLHVCEWRAGVVRRLTEGGTESLSHGEAEFVAQEEMGRSTGYWWSPDSKQLAYEECDARGVEKLFIADPTTPYKAPQSWAYPRAGQANAKVRLGVIPVADGTTHWIEWDREKYPYLATVKWSRNAPLIVVVQSRDQRDEIMMQVDPISGATTRMSLPAEHDDAWVNLEQSMPMWLENGKGFLWLSEADGEWRLTRRNANGGLLGVLNPGDSFRLRGVVHVDEKRGVVIVSGSDRAPESHLYELPLSGVRPDEIKRLTTKPGVHTRIYGRGHDLYVQRFSGMSSDTPYEVCRADGTKLGELPSSAVKPPFPPNVELLRVGPHGEFDAAIVRPRHFVAGRKYPVIVSVYGGPHANVVHAVGRAYVLQQWFADQGFIVVSADNRGTPDRGRAWERAIKGDFGTIPLDDQVTALRAMGAKYPELDLGRVGITGWSFGGYMAALAVCKRGDVFHAAAAGAPVVDWADYDTHYTERYLGLPASNPDGYKRSSILTYADQLRRPLLLIHGTADDNVYFGNSLKLAGALFRAGRPFEFVPLAGYTHMVPDADMTVLVQSRIADFFRKQLIERRPEP